MNSPIGTRYRSFLDNKISPLVFGRTMSYIIDYSATSLTRSLIRSALEGKSDIRVNIGGVISYNFSKDRWGHIGKEGNTYDENLEYFMGMQGFGSSFLADISEFNPKMEEWEKAYSEEVDRQHKAFSEKLVKKNKGKPVQLDPATVGKNLGGTNYNGGNNPERIVDEGKENYTVDKIYMGPDVPITEPIEKPPVPHDIEYFEEDIKNGPMNLLLNAKVVVADFKYVKNQFMTFLLYIGRGEFNMALKSFVFSMGLGVMALPKTITYPVSKSLYDVYDILKPKQSDKR